MRRRLPAVAAALLGAGLVVGAVVLGIMFPSAASLDERPPPDERVTPPRGVVERLSDAFATGGRVAVEGARPDALAQARRYLYLRDSPYLPADRVARGRVFSVAVGDVLLEAALEQVKHEGAVLEGRYAVYVAGGEAISWTLDAPADARLDTAVALLPPFSAGESTCAGSARIELAAGGATKVVWTGELTPTQPFAWRPVGVALTAGRVELRLVVERAPGCAGEAHVFFADPTVHAPAARRALNLLYLNVCTLRADDVGAYGQERPVTPNIDRLAARGTRFATARSNGNWSKSSQMSALLGRYPSSIGNHYFRSPVRPFARATVLHAAWPGLPAVLRARGYATAALVDNVFLHDFLNLGVDLGFERVVDDGRHIRNGSGLADAALDLLEAQGDRPWMLYINIANTHARYRPPRDDLWRSGFGAGDLLGDLDRALHLGEVAFVDRQVGRIVEGLERLGLADDTVVVLHADHGELLDQDRNLEVTVRSTLVPRLVKPYGPTVYKHGWTWFEDEVRIPLVLAGPGVTPGMVVDTPVSLIDLAPTMLGLLDAPLPPTLEGHPLLPAPVERPTLIEGKQFRAVVDGRWKLVRLHEGMDRWRPWGGAWRESPTLLYDLVGDPRETRNLADDPAHAELRARLEALLTDRTPTPPPLHLVAFQGPPGTVFEGEVEGPDAVLTATLRDAGVRDAVRRDGGRLAFRLTTGADPPPVLAFSATDAPRLRVLADGRPLPGASWRLGPHAIPLAAERVLDGRLDLAPLEPFLGVADGQRPVFEGRPRSVPGLHLWTQRVADGGPEPFDASAVDQSLMDAMKDWGYAH